ncbi:MAG: hypothetical protein JO235_15730 [Chroococcidiopsidaceae cyanobacterium CP_BM_RX_35]|nr:hypothetical protein [Chroococcidiopsidaceae cyanobacterium CP_BM_RX_35]MBV9384961.1 hypothetical protein [Chroococcidiopsidaceae cyanobacterium CP_BM_ER_R8_30]
MNNPQTWYIVKRSTNHCEIVPRHQVEESNDSDILERWGPFTSQDEALSRRVGLIRAGKCQPN